MKTIRSLTLWSALVALLSLAFLALGAAPVPAQACGGCPHHAAQAFCPFGADGVEAAVEEIPGGARLTLTAEDVELVATLQDWAESHAERHQGMEGVEASATKLADGASLSLTSDDAETADHFRTVLQRKVTGEGCPHGEGAQQDCPCGQHLGGTCPHRDGAEGDCPHRTAAQGDCPHRDGAQGDCPHRRHQRP